MGDVANKDEAAKALDIAKAALGRGALDRAQKFADKAMKLFPNDEVSSSSSRFIMRVLSRHMTQISADSEFASRITYLHHT